MNVRSMKFDTVGTGLLIEKRKEKKKKKKRSVSCTTWSIILTSALPAVLHLPNTSQWKIQRFWRTYTPISARRLRLNLAPSLLPCYPIQPSWILAEQLNIDSSYSSFIEDMWRSSHNAFLHFNISVCWSVHSATWLFRNKHLYEHVISRSSKFASNCD